MKKTKKLLMLLTLVLSLAMPANMPVLGALSTTETVSAARLNYRQITLVKGRSQRLAMVGTAKKAKWSTSDRRIVSVSQSGVVTGRRKGTARITAKIGNSRYSCKVIVKKYSSITWQHLTMEKGNRLKLGTTARPRKTKWKSSDPNIVFVSKKGTARAVNAGTCKIYATAKTQRYIFKITVKAPVVTPVPQPASVWLSETGGRYHRIPNCGNMDPSKARQVSLSEAQRLGYPACSNCF